MTSFGIIAVKDCLKEGYRMTLEWMGPHRDIIGKIIRYGNMYARACGAQVSVEGEKTLSVLEWQTLECILEYEEENYNMTVLADKLGVPLSNFSRYTKTLINYKLLERFQRGHNHKDIILKVTKRGRALYSDRSSFILEEWKEVFAALDGMSDQQLADFSLFIENLTDSFDPKRYKPEQLIKVE